MNTKVLIILADGFEEVEAITPIDILRRADLNVTTASLNSLQVLGSHNISVTADVTIDQIDCKEFDAVILPGGMPGTKNLLLSDRVIEIVQEMNRDNKLCAAICAAPQVLNKSGILNNTNFTCYPTVEKNIKNGTHKFENVVVSNNIITSKGVGTAIDFALAIIEYLVDTDAADIIAEQIVYEF